MRLQFLPGFCQGRSAAEFILALTGSWQKLSLYLWEKVIPPILFFPSVVALAFYNLFNQSSIISPIGCNVSFISKRKGTQPSRNSPPRSVQQSQTNVCSPSKFFKVCQWLSLSSPMCPLRSYFITPGSYAVWCLMT